MQAWLPIAEALPSGKLICIEFQHMQYRLLTQGKDTFET
jgi:hypothetical protein